MSKTFISNLNETFKALLSIFYVKIWGKLENYLITSLHYLVSLFLISTWIMLMVGSCSWLVFNKIGQLFESPRRLPLLCFKRRLWHLSAVKSVPAMSQLTDAVLAARKVRIRSRVLWRSTYCRCQPASTWPTSVQKENALDTDFKGRILPREMRYVKSCRKVSQEM